MGYHIVGYDERDNGGEGKGEGKVICPTPLLTSLRSIIVLYHHTYSSYLYTHLCTPIGVQQFYTSIKKVWELERCVGCV